MNSNGSRSHQAARAYVAPLASALLLFGALASACTGEDQSAGPDTTAEPASPNAVTSPPRPDPPPSSSTTTESPAPVPVAATAADGDFAEDFVSPDSLSRFDVGIHHRDDYVIKDEEWAADHSITGPGDLCGPPSEKRTVSRGDRKAGFNQDWIYRCIPGGDLEKAHLMTSIGDTSGYSIGAFSPVQVFENVREVRWDVNITDLGTRQFTEVKIIPVDTFDFQDLPCAIEWLPCETSTHSELGSVGASFFSHELMINNGSPQDSTPYADTDDPALTDVQIRRTERFVDNGDGTLSYSIELEDGSFQTITAPGEFPAGQVRVVFADHNYTPTKDEDPIGLTWHWDNIQIDTGETSS